jgi:hypothetical protein
MSQAKKWATAALRIHSAVLDAQAITNALQTEPTRTSIKGDLMSPRNPRSTLFGANMWVLESQLAPESSLEDHIKNLVEFIEQRLPTMKELMKNCQADLFCGYSSDNEQGGVYLEAETIKRLTVIPIDLVLDIYTISN